MNETSERDGNRGDALRAAERFFRDIEIPFLIHELKDPISIIETGLRTLLEKRESFGPLTAKQERTLKRALRNSQKARAMLANLLEIGRSEAGCVVCRRFAPLPVTLQALREALEISAGPLADEVQRCEADEDALKMLSAHGVLCVAAPSVSGLELFQDEVKYRQIAGNLIKNALHHRQRWMEVRLAVSAGNLELSVSDDGPGIDPAHHETVFKRYAQVDACDIGPRKGHGLGLAGARILARSLGGDIQLESQRGKGATFRLTLPCRYPNSDDPQG